MIALFDFPVCASLIVTLGHFLWQGLLVGVLAWSIARMLRGASAVARYRLYLAALTTMAVCPVVTFLWVADESVAILASDDVQTLTDKSRFRTGAAQSEEPKSAGSAIDGAGLTGGLAISSDGPTEETARSSTAVSATKDWKHFAPLLAGTYLTGVMLMLSRLTLGHCGGWRLRKQSEVISDRALLERFARRVVAMKLRTTPVLAHCRHVAVPTVLGVLRPAIVLPTSLVTGLSLDRIDAILMHELAHIRSWDPLVNLLQRIVEAALFFHPMVWFVSRRIRIERELCCDDVVVAMGADPVDYASSLLDVAQSVIQTAAQPELAAVYAVGRRSSDLAHRVRRLLGIDCEEPLRLNRPGLVATAAALFVCSLFAIPPLTGDDLPNRDDATSRESENRARDARTTTTINVDAIEDDVNTAGSENIDLAEFADIIARRIIAQLPFALPENSKHEKQTYAELKEIVEKYGPKNPSVEFRTAILKSLETYFQYLNRFYPEGYRAGNSPQRDKVFLNLPVEIRTLQWKLFMAIRRRPLDAAAQVRLEAQRAWMRQYVRSLPEVKKPRPAGHSRDDVLAKLETKFANLFSPVFHEPLDDEQFAAFQKETLKYTQRSGKSAAERELLHVVPHLVWADFTARWPKGAGTVPHPELGTWNERPEGWGGTNDVIHLQYPKTAAFRGGRNTVSGYREHQHVIDLNDSPPGIRSLSGMPGGSASLEKIDKWFDGQDRGEIMFDAQQKRLIGVRGTRLAALGTHRWVASDRRPTSELIAVLEKDGSRFWPLPEPIETTVDGESKYDTMVAAQTRDGTIYVVHVLEHGFAGLTFHARRRDVE